MYIVCLFVALYNISGEFCREQLSPKNTYKYFLKEIFLHFEIDAHRPGCTHAHAHAHASIHIHTLMLIPMCIHECMHVHTHAIAHAPRHPYTNIYMYTPTHAIHAYAHTHAHIDACVCMHAHVCMHTGTLTYTCKKTILQS